MREGWWKKAVVYQIYPRSFKDSNGDGIGDLPGIIEKLDYLKDLGVDVVWLSPVYKSPNDDNGYDVSDYRDIAPEYGTLADWDALASGLHARGMRIVMDLVVNHSSDEHPWFVSARNSRQSPYRDFYIWRDGRKGGPPNNWASFFGGPAWEYNEPTGDYYLHLFSKKQPDLNWENPVLRREVFDMMHWWLRRGVDGFRMDVINALSKHQAFPDAPNPDGLAYVFAPQFFLQGPRLLDFYGEMKREVLRHYDIMTVGEAALTAVQDAAAVTHTDTGYLNMVISFDHTDVDMAKHNFAMKWHRVPFEPARLRTIMSRWQEGMADGGWNSLYLNNHDQPRAVSRFGDDIRFRRESATLLATTLHMMRGTPFVYQGEELGMTNVAFPTINDYRDIESINGFKELVETQRIAPTDALAMVQFRSRDNARTPIPWNGNANGGFSTGRPWIALNPNYTTINVESEQADPNSVLHYYRKLIALRKARPVIVYGRYDLLHGTADHIWAFTRTLGDEQLLVVGNFSCEDSPFEDPQGTTLFDNSIVIGNYFLAMPRVGSTTVLRPYEICVWQI
jgi:oligo-1,6-glucosidase